MTARKWWIRYCRCGKWAQARPANEFWTKAEDEVEVSSEEFRKLIWEQGGNLRDWYIGNQLTRIVNEHRCK
jgi:hypothetical protein